MKRSISYIAVAATAATLLSSCDKSWLDPKPLSFFAPENTYVNSEGLEAALVAAERNMRHEFFGDGAPILTEMFTSDIAVNGKTDASSSMCDFITQMTPTGLGRFGRQQPDELVLVGGIQGYKVCQYGS